MRMKRTSAVALTAVTAAGLSAALLVPAAAVTPTDPAPLRTLVGTERARSVDVAPDGTVHYLSADRLQVFAAGASGPATPLRTVVGAKTRLVDAVDVSVGPDGHTYVLLDSEKVLVFGPNAKGDVAPVRSIEGDATTLDEVYSMLVGPDGTVYVGDEDQVAVFAPNANGNVAPVRRITGANADIGYGDGLALDRKGNLVVGDGGDDYDIKVFAPNANGDVAPLRRFKPTNPDLDNNRDIAIDSSDNVYSITTDGEVFVLCAGSSGSVEPIRVLSGTTSRLADLQDVVLDADRNVYVVADGDVVVHRRLVEFAKPSAATSLKVGGKKKATQRTVSWTPSADDGGAAVSYEVVVKNGKKTLLRTSTTESSLKVTRANLGKGKHTVTVTATNRAGAAAATSAGFRVAPIAPGKVGSLVVKGKAGAAKRKVSWKAPWTGGLKLTGYRVVVKRGKQVLVERDLRPAKRSTVLRKDELGKGKHTVLVRAGNKKGAGKAAKVRFRVK